MSYLLRTAFALFFALLLLSGCDNGKDDSVQAVTDNTPPSVPHNVVAKITESSVIFSWDAVASATSYNLYIAEEPGVSAANYQQLMSGDVYFSDKRQLEITGLAYDSHYYVVVSAVKNGLESANSDEIDFITPAQPSGAVRAVAGAKTIIVSWDSVPSADSYNLYIAEQAGISPDTINQLTNGKAYVNVTSSFEITGLTKNISYYILVTSVSAGIESNVGAEIEKTIVNLPLLNPTAIATSNYAACALDDNGITCWGDTFNHVERVPYMENPIAIAGGTGHFCAILSDSTVKCWGWNAFGQSTPPASLTNVSAISAGSHTCALLTDKSLICWGNNNYGQLIIPTLSNTSLISVGGLFSCALDDSGVVCWGNNSNGESTPPSLSKPSLVAAGLYNACALDENGVQCWGRDVKNYAVPELSTPTELTVGLYHACALDSVGVKCWGANDKGQLDVPVLSKPTEISAGNEFNCALDENGVHCWGDGLSGQLLVP